MLASTGAWAASAAFVRCTVPLIVPGKLYCFLSTMMTGSLGLAAAADEGDGADAPADGAPASPTPSRPRERATLAEMACFIDCRTFRAAEGRPSLSRHRPVCPSIGAD